LSKEGKIYVLEANPNAGIARDEDVIFSAKKAGLSYEAFIQKILNLAISSNVHE
jgi:D-alanine-D-alanine ligase-like ATP-grasp enzyme